MGLQQSKGKLVSQQVRDGNSEGILALIREGADLEVQYRYLIDWLFEFLVN